jgi:tripartite ATP-independent transporter DctP family solute receptor
MSHSRTILGLAAAAALVAAVPAEAQEFEMRLGHVLSDTSPYQVIFTAFEKLVEERSGGRIAVEFTCCAQEGNEARQIQQMRTGLQAGAMIGGSTLETVVPAYRVLSLPYLFDEKAQAYEILQSDMGREMLDLLEPFDLHGLGFGSIYERSVASFAPIRTVADMQGLKIRVLPTPGFVEAYNALGTQPTPMAYGEVFMALQNRVVDALEISPDAFVADRFHEVVKNYTLTKTHQSTTVFVLSKAFWDSLPADLQEIVQASALEAIAEGIAAHDRLAADGLVTAAAAGVTIIEPDLAPFAEMARKSWDVILKDQPEATEYLARFQAFMGR